MTPYFLSFCKMEIRAAQSSSNIIMTGPEHIVMVASSDHIEGTESSHPTPHLLEVLNVLQDASGMQKAIQELYESYYREEDLSDFFILLSMLCNVFQGFLQYVKKGTRFLTGRVYCTDCGAVLLNHDHEQNLVAEELVRPLSGETELYSAQSFVGQVDLENHLRAGFRELQRIGMDSRRMIIDICIPKAAGRLPPNRRRTGSATSVSSPSTRRSNRQRARMTNPSHYVEVDGDDEEIEVTSGTSTDSRDVHGEICEKCKVTRDLAIGAGSSGAGSGRDDDDAGVNLIVDI